MIFMGSEENKNKKHYKCFLFFLIPFYFFNALLIVYSPSPLNILSSRQLAFGLSRFNCLIASKRSSVIRGLGNVAMYSGIFIIIPPLFFFFFDLAHVGSVRHVAVYSFPFHYSALPLLWSSCVSIDFPPKP